MSIPLLGVRGLRVQAGEKLLCMGLDLEVRPGQFWCLVGRNGAGKSTLLHTLAGLHVPAAGGVLLEGRELEAVPLDVLARKRGLMMQQQFDAFSSSVLETVLAARHPYQPGLGWENETDRAIAASALAAVGLADCAARDIMSLSGGERQRVALAALLAQDPDLLLLDEPTAQQDAAAQLLVMGRLRELCCAGEGTGTKAVIAACHDINLVARYATHVLVLAEGRHWAGPAHEVLTASVLEPAFACRFEVLASDRGPVFLPIPG